MPDLHIEVGTAELPPGQLQLLSNSMADNIVRGLRKEGIAYGRYTVYATPRRMAVIVKDVGQQQEDRIEKRKGPTIGNAFNADGTPSKALLGFAKSCGVGDEQINTLKNTPQLLCDKDARVAFRITTKDLPTTELLGKILTDALDDLPIHKKMRWGDSIVSFVRPIQWITIILGDHVVNTEVYGIKTGNYTLGHRFLHPDPIYLCTIYDYEEQLEDKGYVIPNFNKRRDIVKGELDKAASEINARVICDDDLLDEVAGLVEWPSVIIGSFDESFLDIPKEVLTTTMRKDQRYFSLINNEGEMLPKFAAVLNIESKDPSVVIRGNERVLRARFFDAQFFWNEDLKQPLSDKLELLKDVVYQQKLGSQYDKTMRVVRLAKFIAESLECTSEALERAAILSRCDLLTSTVREYTNLQGVIGKHLAVRSNEANEVAIALDEMYMPRFSNGQLPNSYVGKILALADRIDTLMGFFYIGYAPTSTKDPFGLRRATLGVLRILIETKISLDLRKISLYALQGLPGYDLDHDAHQGLLGLTNTALDIFLNFVDVRLRVYEFDKGIRSDIFDAVSLTTSKDNILRFDQHAEAVSACLNWQNANEFITANKRVANILKDSIGINPDHINGMLFETQSEVDLHVAIIGARLIIDKYLKFGAYEKVMTELFGLINPLTAFFNDNMVLVDEPKIRFNRLCLLTRTRTLFLSIADFSRITEKGE